MSGLVSVIALDLIDRNTRITLLAADYGTKSIDKVGVKDDSTRKKGWDKNDCSLV